MWTAEALKIGPLKTRETPQQARAKARVEAILRATAEQLSARPLHVISTTSIAEQAGIPVSSIYRYFPTLEDLFEELYQQTSDLINARVLEVFQRTDDYPGWRDRLRANLGILQSFFLDHPYYRTLLISHIAQTGPELLDPAQPENVNTIANFLARRWSSGEDGFQGGNPTVVANVTMQVFLSIENLIATRIPVGESHDYYDTLFVNLESYLANFLADDR